MDDTVRCDNTKLNFESHTKPPPKTQTKYLRDKESKYRSQGISQLNCAEMSEVENVKSSINYGHSERNLAMWDNSHIRTDLGVQMKPRPSDIHKFSASCVKIKNDTVLETEIRTKFKDFAEKNKLWDESYGSEAVDEDTELVDI